MRRRTGRPAISLAEVPKPLSIETQASQAIEARPLLLAALEAQNDKLQEAELQAARTFASQTHAGGYVDVEKAFQSSRASKESEEQIKQRIAALEYFKERLNTHVEYLKANYPDAVAAAIDLRLAALEASQLEKETSGKDLAQEIKDLKTERTQLKGPAKKAAYK